MVISWFICGRCRACLLHLSVSLLVVTTTLKIVGGCSAFRCSIQSVADWFGQALISVCVNTPGQEPRQQRQLTNSAQSHGTAPGAFQTELEEGEQSSVKETDFRMRVWWAHHWRLTYGTSTQHSPWWGLVVNLAAIKCPTLPSFELFLVRGLSIFITITISPAFYSFLVEEPYFQVVLSRKLKN